MKKALPSFKMIVLILAISFIATLGVGCKFNGGSSSESTDSTVSTDPPSSTDPTASDVSELYYNEAGFNIPGLTFQPAVPDVGGVRFEPVEVFENVYFIGDSWICAMIYDTGDGLILWDSLESAADMTEILQPDMEKLGLDIADIKIVLVSHGHGDHFGGAFYLQKTYGAKVYMSEDDVPTMEASWARGGAEVFGVELEDAIIDEYLVDGGTVSLGDVTFTMMHTPGHTPGSMSFFVPVTAFDGTQHSLTCWGGTSAPKDAAGTLIYRDSVQKYRDYINANGVDSFLSMHPFVDYSTAKVNTVRETGSSDALIRTPEQMDLFCWTLDVYCQTKSDMAAEGISYPFIPGAGFLDAYGDDSYGYGSAVLSVPYAAYIPEDGKNAARYLDQIIRAEIFDDVYLVGTGKDACLIYDTGDGIVITDAMTSEKDFTQIVKPAMDEFGLDASRISVVMITNGHADKTGFASYLKQTYGTQIYMNTLDADLSPDLSIDVDLTEGDLTFGAFTFNWVHTPGYTDGCMSYLVDVTIAGTPHTAICWGGTTFIYEASKLADYCDSIDKFRTLSQEAGADAMVSTHPYFNYSVQKVLDLVAGDDEAFIYSGYHSVDFALAAISVTAQHKLNTVGEDRPSPNVTKAEDPPRSISSEVAELYYNEAGFNVPGLTFQPAVPDVGGVRFEPVEVFENVYFIGDSWICAMIYDTGDGLILWDSLESAADMTEILQPDMEKLGLDIADIKIVLVSHGHGDHFGGAFYLQKTYGAKVYMSQEDVPTMEASWARGGAEVFGVELEDAVIDEYLVDGGTVSLGDVTFTMMHTPGHTPGSMSFFVPVTAFDGTQHTLTCWGGTSAPKDAAGTLIYRDSVQKYRDYINANGVDSFLSMHPFVDYSTAKVDRVRETGSSDALIQTSEQMDLFCWTLDVYCQTKSDMAAEGISYPFIPGSGYLDAYGADSYGYGSAVLSVPYAAYIPEDGKNAARYLDQIIRAEIFDDVYLVGTGKDACLIYDTVAGIVLTDAMTSETDFTQIVKPAMDAFGLDASRITAVMITNGHADKTGFALYLQQTYGAQIYMNTLDAALSPDLTIDINLTEGELTFGAFTFNWVHTPGYTDGCMSYLVNVAIDGAPHTAACWSGTSFVYEEAKLADYCDSIDNFRTLSLAAGTDAMVSTHPYFNYSVQKVLDLQAGNDEAFIYSGYHSVDFALTVISMTAQHKLNTLRN